MLSHRNFMVTDAVAISGFPRSAQELFYFIPTGRFPLDPKQVMDAARKRHSPTVVLVDDEVAAFANIYDVHLGEYCCTGNVIVDSSKRGQGVGSYLLHCMEQRAITEYGATEHRLSCFASNTRALTWYSRMGYQPFAMEERSNYLGRPEMILHMAKKSCPGPAC
ncbi:MAG: GNAT family N-acetyltransferase [Desulfovibrio sp.]|nr:MAG: GNAT family N-acetyltransferase [Desulfovibrio sp.]